MNAPDAELHEDPAEFLRGAMKALPDASDFTDDNLPVLNAIAEGLHRRATELQLAIHENNRERNRLRTEAGLFDLAELCLSGFAERAGITDRLAPCGPNHDVRE